MKTQDINPKDYKDSSSSYSKIAGHAPMTHIITFGVRSLSFIVIPPYYQ